MKGDDYDYQRRCNENGSSKDTKAKRTESSVYGTLNKNSNFHELGLYQVNSKTLKDWFNEFDKFKLSQIEKIRILKEVLLAQQEEIR